MPEDTQDRAVLVDDNLLFSTQIETGLRRLGFRATTLAPGPAAAQQAAALAPRLVLINLSSNRERALETIRRLRAAPDLAGTCILGFAGHTDTETLHLGREAGADQVVANSAVTGHLEAVLKAAGVLEG